MGIYWRGRGKEKAAWGRIRIAGQEYRGPLGTKSKRDAPAAYQIWLADLKKDLANPGDAASATTWRDAVGHFLEHHFPTLKQSTQVRYLQSIETLTPHFERQTLQALREAEAYPGPSLIIAYSHCIAHGIDMDAVTEKLQVDGVAAFSRSFDTLLAAIDDVGRDLVTALNAAEVADRPAHIELAAAIAAR